MKKKITKKKIVSKKKISVKSLKKKAAPQKTYISIILDCSGSMATIRKETIEHFNEQIEQITKNSKGLDTRVSLVTFNSVVDEKFFNESLDRLQPLTLETYVPNGWTAMYDAVGLTIDKMKEIKDINRKNVAALVIILSDGEENSSKQYTSEDIATRVKALQGTKRWTFTYLGANQDLSKIQQKLNIPVGNIQAFAATPDGMKAATNLTTSSTSAYLSSRRVGTMSVNNFYK